MLQVLARAPGGQSIVAVSQDAGEADSPGVLPTEWPRDLDPYVDDLGEVSLAWYDLSRFETKQREWVASRFHFHPLAMEACAQPDEHPQGVDYLDHLFIVIHALALKKDEAGPTVSCELQLQELHLFLKGDQVVTVHEGGIPAVTELFASLSRDLARLPARGDRLIHLILDAVTRANRRTLQQLDAELLRLDELVLSPRNDASQLLALALDLNHGLNRARHALHPQVELYEDFATEAHVGLRPETQVFFADLASKAAAVSDKVDRLRESLRAVRETQLSIAAYRTNEIMRGLTAFSVIFLPLSFITGFFGMNFETIPWKHSGLFLGAMGSLIVVPIGILFWLSLRRWL